MAGSERLRRVFSPSDSLFGPNSNHTAPLHQLFFNSLLNISDLKLFVNGRAPIRLTLFSRSQAFETQPTKNLFKSCGSYRDFQAMIIYR